MCSNHVLLCGCCSVPGLCFWQHWLSLPSNTYMLAVLPPALTDCGAVGLASWWGLVTQWQQPVSIYRRP
jgi:hypothetical protein